MTVFSRFSKAIAEMLRRLGRDLRSSLVEYAREWPEEAAKTKGHAGEDLSGTARCTGEPKQGDWLEGSGRYSTHPGSSETPETAAILIAAEDEGTSSVGQVRVPSPRQFQAFGTSGGLEMEKAGHMDERADVQQGLCHLIHASSMLCDIAEDLDVLAINAMIESAKLGSKGSKIEEISRSMDSLAANIRDLAMSLSKADQKKSGSRSQKELP